MVYFHLLIETDNDAFQEGGANEIRRILDKVAEQVDGVNEEKPILDVNGNTVGRWYFGVDFDPVKLPEGAVVILHGDPVDGLEVVGPFLATDGAMDYAERNSRPDREWWVTQIDPGF